MNKIKKFFFVILIYFIALSSSVFAQNQKCKNPQFYGLSPDEVNISNSDFYCWEIKYLKEYHNLLSTSLLSYYNYYSNDLNKENIDILRKLGITPEKYTYLYKYFIDDEIAENINFETVIESAVSKAKNELSNKLQYHYSSGYVSIDSLATIPAFVNGISTSEIFSIAKNTLNPLQFFEKNVHSKYLAVLGMTCITTKKISEVFSIYPTALEPIGVIGKYFINAFGEVIAEIKEVNNKNKIFLINTQKHIGDWGETICPITDLNKTVKKAFSCTACTMFEIAFNTVSKIGFVLYDKLSRYALNLMIILFSIWSLFMFFENAIKKQDGFAYIKQFFSKVVWVFIIGAFLSVSITDENNIVNYTIKPLTDFMVGYNQVMTKVIDRTSHSEKLDNSFHEKVKTKIFNKSYADECKFKTKDLKDNKYLFSKDVKQNIVCTIERISGFNNMNIMVGIEQMKFGLNQLLNFKIGTGIFRILIGLGIAGMFFMFNLSVPYFFIESLFNIAIVVFLFPLFLMGYAFDKGKSFVKEGLNTFLSAISQIIALSIMCAVISLLMYYITPLDFSSMQQAIENNDAQDVASSLLLAFSFTPNQLLEMLYTSIICWWLLGQTLSIANVFGGKETLPETFKNFMKSSVKWATNITVDYNYMKLKTNTLNEKIKKMIKTEKEEKEARDKTKSKAEELLKESENVQESNN